MIRYDWMVSVYIRVFQETIMLPAYIVRDGQAGIGQRPSRQAGRRCAIDRPVGGQASKRAGGQAGRLA